jgi:hypothetical protein
MADNALAHQIVTRAIGGHVDVVIVRDPSDGAIRHGVRFVSGSTRWISRHSFQDLERAAAGADVLSDFLLGGRL